MKRIKIRNDQDKIRIDFTDGVSGRFIHLTEFELFKLQNEIKKFLGGNELFVYIVIKNEKILDKVDGWTTDLYKAKHFKSESEAENYIQENGIENGRTQIAVVKENE